MMEVEKEPLKRGWNKDIVMATRDGVGDKREKSAKGYVVSEYPPLNAVEKEVVNELLLVCGVIGSTTTTSVDGVNKVVPVADCLAWLQDLQRALRRDDDMYRPISLLLGGWRVVSTKLIPLMMGCQYDTALVLTICKILVILTKPLNTRTQRAIHWNVETKNQNSHVVKEQIRIRENALKQEKQLSEYRSLLFQHSGVLSVLVSALSEPLSKTTSRTDSDHLTIELILHLFRNILAAKTSDANSSAILVLFQEKLVLDIFLMLGQEMEASENRGYNLLLLEILHYLFQNQDPTLVANSHNEPNHTPRTHPTNKTTSNPLTIMRQKHRRQLRARTPSRHANFSPKLFLQNNVINNRTSSHKTNLTPMTTSDLLSCTEEGKAPPIAPSYSTVVRRATKENRVFLGSPYGQRAAYTILNPGRNTHNLQAQRALHTFLTKFVPKCYGPVMKSLKNEFRRDSARLEQQDKPMFFRIIWFILNWWRTCQQQNQNNNDDSTSAMGQLIFTLDVFSITLVMHSIDSYLASKNYIYLEQTVALYTEMMYGVHMLYHSKHDNTEHMMSLGLMDKLFYGNDPMDRLSKLLSTWAPMQHTKDYLCDLVELNHITLKLLYTHKSFVQSMENNGKIEEMDAIQRMKATAAEFEVGNYFERKIVSHHTVYMYTQLLSKYDMNSALVNNHIVSFFVRMMEHQVGDSKTDDNIDRKSTLEPMLYNIQVFIVLERILNDKAIQDQTHVVNMAATIIRRFARAAAKNPLLYVEALLRHTNPRKFCSLATNHYVTEEHTLMLERHALMDEARREEEMVQALAKNNQQEEDEEEQFVSDRESESENKQSSKLLSKRRFNRKEKRSQLDSDSENDEDELEIISDKEQNEVQFKSSKRRRLVPKGQLLNQSNDDTDNEFEFEDSNQIVNEEKETFDLVNGRTREKLIINRNETNVDYENKEVENKESADCNHEKTVNDKPDDSISEEETTISEEEEKNNSGPKDEVVQIFESPSENHTEDNVNNTIATLEKNEFKAQSASLKSFRKNMVLDDSDDEVELHNVSAGSDGKFRLVLDDDDEV